MATQYTTDIPFSACHVQQPLKLLELPAELLAALESENPPTLTIASSSTTPSFAFLTSTSITSTEKYHMRQKNTSNPIMVLKSCRTGPSQADDASTFVSKPSLARIATIGDTIELVRQQAEGVAKAVPKANKWHEKFARSRGEKKG